MPYTGPEPARRPLSSDDITDGIISTADLANSAVTTAKIGDATLTALSSVMSSTATTAAQRAALGLDTGDTPQFTNLSLQGYFPNSFTLEIYNAGGTLQHRLMASNINSTAPYWWGGINAPSVTRQNTPTGADSSTAMAYGGKISTGSTNNFIFDTAALSDSLAFGICAIGYNTTSTAGVIPQLLTISRDVNGPTRNRMEMRFSSAGTAWALNTTNIANTKLIQVTCLMWLPVYA